MSYWTYHPTTLTLTGGPLEVAPAADVPVTEVAPPAYEQGHYICFDGSRWYQRPVPSVLPVAGRIVLRRAGLMPSVESAIAAAGGEAVDWFEYSLEWRRLHPVVIQMGAALGLSDSQLDDLFIRADYIGRQELKP